MPARPSHQFGSHLSVAGGIYHAADQALSLGFSTVQVFVKNQRQWVGPPIKPEDAQRWSEAVRRPGFGPTVAHASYLINLASADDTLQSRSREALLDELRRCDTLDIPYLVVHPGAAGEQSESEAVARVAAALNRLHADAPQLRCMLLLETTAGQGTTLGRTFTQLAAMIDGLETPQRVGVCVDTCHVFAAGYDIRSKSGYREMIAEAADTVGLERIRCWHLNDSRGDCGSRLDRHEHIGRGRIGSRGFANVLGDERFRGLPMILETPKGLDDAGRDFDKLNLRRLRTIATRAAGRDPAR